MGSWWEMYLNYLIENTNYKFSLKHKLLIKSNSLLEQIGAYLLKIQSWWKCIVQNRKYWIPTISRRRHFGFYDVTRRARCAWSCGTISNLHDSSDLFWRLGKKDFPPRGIPHSSSSTWKRDSYPFRYIFTHSPPVAQGVRSLQRGIKVDYQEKK